MSKRRSKRPSQGSQPKKPPSSDPFNTKPFANTPSVSPARRAAEARGDTAVDPVQQMPGVMGQPPRGKGFIPLSGGPKVKKGDRVGPPEDLIRNVNRPKTVDGDPNSQTIIPTVSPRKKGEGQPRPRQKVRGNYSNPMDFVKPSDFLSPVLGQPQKLPRPNEGFGPTDEPYGPVDTRPRQPRSTKPVPIVPPVPFPPKEEVISEPPHSPSAVDDGIGVFLFNKGRFLTRGKYNGQTSRSTQRRG